jgi:hypothetical protein
MVQKVLDDPYSDEVLQSIPLEVRQTLTTEQRVAIKQALAGRKHGVDVRFVLPLFFTQLYFVVLVGKDRRHQTHRVTYERRAAVGRFGTAFGIAFVGIVAILIALGGLYVAKSRAGVDLFPNSHLKDSARQIGL